MRKKLKSIVMIFASILLCGSNMLSTVMIKANVTKLEDTGYWHSGQAHNPDNPAQTAWFDHQKIEKIHVEQGVGVCSEPWEVIGDWGGYVTSPIQEGRIADIWNYAYVNTNQSKWNYAVGQLMVWEYLGYKPTAHNVPNYEKRKAEVNASIANMSKKPSFSGKKIILNIGESKTLTDTNGVLSDFKGKESVPKGISVKRNGNKLTVTASTTAAENSTYSLNKIRPEMIGQSIVHRKPGGQDILVPLRADPGTFKLKIQVNKYGALKITKQDEDGNLVPNTSFKVSKNADMSSPIGTYKTGSDGTVTVNDLAPATYYVQESAVPNHLILDKTIHTVSVSANKTASFTARNKWKKGRVQIRKVDTDSKKQVAGATYAIFNQQGQELQRLVTKASGYSMSGYLRVGAYYVQEVIAPKGYTLNKTKYPVTISKNNQTITVTGTDKRQSGTLKLSKADSKTNKKPQGDATLQGAVYELRAKENILDPADQSVKYKKGALVTTLTTDKNGNATKTGLYLGKYTLKETKASPGYRLDPKSYDVTISPAAQTTSVITVSKNVLEDIIKLRIHKVQEEPKLNIPNTIFTFTKPNGTTSEVKTDKSGLIQFVGLRPGVYKLKEKAVMDGYDINPTEVRFEVVSGGGVKVLTDLTNTGITFRKTDAFDGIVTVSDKVSPFTLKITKLNDHEQLLDGAEFTLYSDKACTKVVAKRTSYNGVLSFAGLKDRTKYYLKETKAPDGYRIPLDPDTKQPHVYEIETVSSPVNDLFELWVDGKKYTPKDTVTTGAIRIEGTKKARVVHMEIVNMVGIKLPETGSDLMFPMFIIGMGLMFLGRKSLRGGVRE